MSHKIDSNVKSLSVAFIIFWAFSKSFPKKGLNRYWEMQDLLTFLLFYKIPMFWFFFLEKCVSLSKWIHNMQVVMHLFFSIINVDFAKWKELLSHRLTHTGPYEFINVFIVILKQSCPIFVFGLVFVKKKRSKNELQIKKSKRKEKNRLKSLLFFSQLLHFF